MTSNEIRQAFLSYFANHQHQEVPSASLIPHNDPTLLFTNAGMVPFKECFLGLEDRGYKRATSSQRCVRAGGKHNDLENVGYTARHHTFFEMLGNFSFGDYFKADAIRFAWDFLTKELGIPEEKLWVTVFHDDQEAENIWFNEIGINQQRFSRLGEKDNFWSMGDTGPCGPCSEIFYDHGAEVPGGPPGSPDEDGDRYIEIWNLVFMQFNRHADGTQEPLPEPSVDTGMGLERIAAVIQNVHSNYEIDIFEQLIKSAAKITGASDLSAKSLRVIADHIRSCAFLIADGVMPNNEGRGYVLRRIIRRAIRHGHQLGCTEVFFYKLVQPLIEQMGQAYPELVEHQTTIEKSLKAEEEQFIRTLDQGLKILEQGLAEVNGKEIPGELVFKLYDTYGFPKDLTADIAREKGLSIDDKGFDVAMEAQRQRARSASQFDTDYNDTLEVNQSSQFTGYHKLEDKGQIVALYRDNREVEQLEEGEEGMLVLDVSPFYAESGGQVGDRGFIESASGRFEVLDTRKAGDAIAHWGKLVSGTLGKGDQVDATLNAELRQQTVLNHSATHLLHEALRQLLGEHVTQKGSLVEPDRLRFDFSHGEAVTPEQLREIEQAVNAQIRANLAVTDQQMSMDEAKAAGAMALFGEKYGDQVRVLTMGDFSIELCGGTHVERTGDIGLFKILSEGGIASGVRRIEAVTGAAAVELVSQQEAALQQLAGLVKSDLQSVPAKVSQIQDKLRAAEKQVQQLQAKLAQSKGGDLLSDAQEIKGVKLLVANLEGVNGKALRDSLDQLKPKLERGIIVLASSGGDKVGLIVGVTNNLTDTVKASELVNFVAQQVGGKGGGRPDMAQAGGNQPENLQQALDSVTSWVEGKLS